MCRIGNHTSAFAKQQPISARGVAPGWHAHLEALEDAADGVFTTWDKLIAREKRINPLYEGRIPA